MDDSQFKVIIVGGSIAGLSLAHCLYKAGITCIILEKRSEIAAYEGASVAIMPNGGRILEQLGLYEAVERLIEPMHVAHVRFPDGFHFSSPYPKVMHEAFGFPMAFISRQKLLEILYHSFPEKSKIYVDKTVNRIEYQNQNIVLVHTQDGRFYRGDLVVGADGVHSCVRTQMWHIADTLRPGMIPSDEKTGMTVSYACIFGISSEVPELKIGHLHLSVHNGKSFIIAPGIHGRQSWFVVLKLDNTYPYSSAPRFSPKDAASLCEQLTEMYVWGNIQFAQLWQRQEIYSMAPLEENIFRTWHFGRIVCIGDSMHKMTPNLAQGANCSIEDAASLANTIYDALNTKDHQHRLSDQEVDHHLCLFNKLQIDRMTRIYKASRMVAYFAVLCAICWKRTTEKALKILQGAIALSFIPLPQRSGPRWVLPRKTENRPFAWAGATLVLLLLGLIWRPLESIL
ncbi:FAD binding monooxygenase [Penicillium samsonianum]|uniref:FAD binding monooxygenase n=1 Tax=Penicillium samsonianum TaxID=1882272 RepID=UPI0025493801|nr:FAD binding monooxygenase [Penicillium samsonianum]KAJ6118338.1 FAD binding monooxygenase [Penicillium samsonianum]